MLTSTAGRAAKLQYLMNGFRVLAPGDHVLCAISGVAIPLEELRYWSVEKQQPYAGADLASQAFARR